MIGNVTPEEFNEELSKVLASPAFNTKPVCRDILVYLAEKSFPSNLSGDRTAKRVAEKFAQTVEAIPNHCKHINAALDEHYEGEGKGARRRVTLHKGGRLEMRRRENYLVTLEWCGPRPTHMFWEAHWDRKDPILLATNAPLFFRNREGDYRIRVMAVNHAYARDRHQEEGREPQLSTCDECFHYVSIGDLKICVALSTFFTKKGQTVKTKVAYSTQDYDDVFSNSSDKIQPEETSNLIAFGNPRVSWVVTKLQSHFAPNFFLEPHTPAKMLNRRPGPGEDEFYPDVVGNHGFVYAAVIRSVEDGRAQTMILVQNGPALEAVGSILINDGKMQDLLDKLDWDEFPTYFELLFRIGLGEREIVQPDTAKLIAWRPLSRGA